MHYLLLTLCFFFSTCLLTTCSSLFFFSDTATTEIYTLSLHDALPIFDEVAPAMKDRTSGFTRIIRLGKRMGDEDRKSTRLNSSHQIISYAVFCLKKKKEATSEVPRKQTASLKASLTPRYSERSSAWL